MTSCVISFVILSSTDHRWHLDVTLLVHLTKKHTVNKEKEDDRISLLWIFYKQGLLSNIVDIYNKRKWEGRKSITMNAVMMCKHERMRNDHDDHWAVHGMIDRLMAMHTRGACWTMTREGDSNIGNEREIQTE